MRTNQAIHPSRRSAAILKSSSLSVLRLTLLPALASGRTQPSVFVGGADESFEDEGLCQIVDAAGGAACFHDDEVDLVFLKIVSRSFRSV
ncbi:MAG: hypothetical protein MUC83_06995, partial [Pirellula sp.]|nr:hypothetical protein [Pirellula sp.]